MSRTIVLLSITTAASLLLICGANPVDHSTLSRSLQEKMEEEQLESLKSFSDNQNLEISNSQSTKMVSRNGEQVEMHQKTEQKIKNPESGQTVARLTKEQVTTKDQNTTKPKTTTKTELEVPAKGIHRVVVDKKAKSLEDSNEMTEDYYAPLDSMPYTPIDIAEYIRRTGDNDGVAMAVDELINEGLMTKPEAEAYLDAVKSEMEFEHSTSQSAMNPYSGPPNSQQFVNKNENIRRQNSFGSTWRQHSPSNQHQKYSPGSNPNFYPSNRFPNKPMPATNHKMNFMSKSNYFPNEEESEMLVRPAMSREAEEDNDYNDLVERIRIADFLYKEYSLEEIIYQLAKDMFIQSSLKGTNEAEQSLQRFSNFLQDEAAEGRISKELGIRILDVVMAALIDAMSEQQQVAPPKPNAPMNNPQHNRIDKNDENGRRQDFSNRSGTDKKPSLARTIQTKGSAEQDKSSKAAFATSANMSAGGTSKTSVTSKGN
ncbi:hypothetical protein CHUAL_007113 [Chamberlinius hualienensis]